MSLQYRISKPHKDKHVQHAGQYKRDHALHHVAPGMIMHCTELRYKAVLTAIKHVRKQWSQMAI